MAPLKRIKRIRGCAARDAFITASREMMVCHNSQINRTIMYF
jgi:hypothetical protein